MNVHPVTGKTDTDLVAAAAEYEASIRRGVFAVTDELADIAGDIRNEVARRAAVRRHDQRQAHARMLAYVDGLLDELDELADVDERRYFAVRDDLLRIADENPEVAPRIRGAGLPA